AFALLLLLLPLLLSLPLLPSSSTPPPTTPDPRQLPPPVTIHQYPLDANPSPFYSVRIFDTLAPPANPVAVPRRTICAATKAPPHFIQSAELLSKVFNPVPPDGGQHTT